MYYIINENIKTLYAEATKLANCKITPQVARCLATYYDAIKMLKEIQLRAIKEDEEIKDEIKEEKYKKDMKTHSRMEHMHTMETK